MNPGEFAKRRALIEAARFKRGRRYARNALAALVKQAKATTIHKHGQVVAWRMVNGGIVCRKRRFISEAEAMLALATAQQQGYKRSKTPCRYYVCPYCSGWHLTSH